MQYSYLVIGNDEGNAKETLLRFEEFPEFYCVGTAVNNDEAVDKILELQPQLVFLELNPKSKSDVSMSIITDLYRYINVLPYFIILSDTQKFAFEAIKHGVFDYLQQPITLYELRKCLFKFKKQVLWPQYDGASAPAPKKDEATGRELFKLLLVNRKGKRLKFRNQKWIYKYV